MPCNSSKNMSKAFASPPSLHIVIKDIVLTSALDRDGEFSLDRDR